MNDAYFALIEKKEACGMWFVVSVFHMPRATGYKPLCY